MSILADPVLSIVLCGVLLMVITACVAFAVGSHRGWGKGLEEGRNIWAKARDEEYMRRMVAVETGRRDVVDRDARIAKLTAQLEEALAMARKPLTPDQLDACKAKDGRVCPRCGNEDDDEIEPDSIEIDEDDGSVYQDVECKDCSEVWRVFYKIDRVEDLEDD